MCIRDRVRELNGAKELSVGGVPSQPTQATIGCPEGIAEPPDGVELPEFARTLPCVPRRCEQLPRRAVEADDPILTEIDLSLIHISEPTRPY